MNLAAAVRAEQIRALYRQSRLVLWTNVAISGLVSGALWWAASRPALLAWIGLMTVIALGRSELMRRVETVQPSTGELEPWGRRFVFGCMIAGAAWGLGILAFFDPSSPMSQILLTFAIGGMTAAAAGTWASHPPAFWGYFMCSLGPLLLRTLALGDSAHLALGGMLVAYTAGMARVVRTNHQTLTQAFRLGLENSQLLARLSQRSNVKPKRCVTPSASKSWAGSPAGSPTISTTCSRS
jgi:hypothetical protein